MSDKAPTIGRIVIYRYSNGLDAPAVVTATQESLAAADLDERSVRPLTSPENVHLTVFTPSFVVQAGAEYTRDVPKATDAGDPAAHTWRWPERPMAADGLQGEVSPQ